MIVDFQHHFTSIPRGDLAELTPFSFIVVAARGGFCDAKASVCRKLVAG